MMENYFESIFYTFFTEFEISGLDLTLGTLAEYGVFVFESTKITLKHSKIHDINCKSANFYLFRSISLLEVSIDIVFKDPDLKIPSFTEDKIIIFETILENGNFLLLTYKTAIFYLLINGSTIRNMNDWRNNEPFINIICEKEVLFMNSTFDSIILNNTFLMGIGKNITFLGNSLINSIFLNIFDFFVKSRIDSELPKIISNFSHSRISNITVTRFRNLDQPLKLFHYNPYSRGYGFFLTFFENITFEKITNPTPSVTDNLIYFAAGHSSFINCTFSDIANLTLHRFYPRLPDSTIYLGRNIYNLLEHQVFGIWLVTQDYFVKETFIENCFFNAFREFSFKDPISFLNNEYFIFKNNVIKNIFNTFGTTMRIKCESIKKLTIKDSFFINNTGSNSMAADISIETVYPSEIDWNLLNKNSFESFGVENCNFYASKGASCLLLEFGSELFIFNSTFSGANSKDYGGVLQSKENAKLFLFKITIFNVSSGLYGGSIYIVKSFFLALNLMIISSSSAIFGGFMMFTRSSKVLIQDSSLEYLSSSSGGALWGKDSSLQISNTKIGHSQVKSQASHLYLLNSVLSILDSEFTSGISQTSGSIYGEQIQFKINNFTISDTSVSEDSGQGIFFVSGISNGDASLQNFKCLNNTGMSGSCIFAFDLNLKMQNCFLSQNKASKYSVVVIFMSNSPTSLIIRRSIFKNNLAPQSLMSFTSTQVSIEKSLFLQNFAEKGVIFLVKGLILLEENIFYHENLTTFHSKLFFSCFLMIESSQSISLLDNIFDSSFCGNHLLIIEAFSMNISNCYFMNGHAEYNAGSISFIDSSVYISGCKFLMNEAGSGGALYLESSHLNLNHCIFKRLNILIYIFI